MSTQRAQTERSHSWYYWYWIEQIVYCFGKKKYTVRFWNIGLKLKMDRMVERHFLISGKKMTESKWKWKKYTDNVREYLVLHWGRNYEEYLIYTSTRKKINGILKSYMEDPRVSSRSCVWDGYKFLPQIFTENSTSYQTLL